MDVALTTHAQAEAPSRPETVRMAGNERYAPELKWLKIPLDMWVPDGLKDFQQGWFVNLLRASLRSENIGYLFLCEEGCSGCLACLWRVANAHHPEYFKKHSSLVLACFNSARIAGRRVLYFPRLVDTVNGQLSRLRIRSKSSAFSESSTELNKGDGFSSPSTSLFFDFDSNTKNQGLESNEKNSRKGSVVTMPKENEKPLRERFQPKESDLIECSVRILNILGLDDSSLNAAMAAVQAESKRWMFSADGIVQRVVTAANLAERQRIPKEEFLGNFLAEGCARGLLQAVNLPITSNMVLRVAAVVKAEAKDTGMSLEEAANYITERAVGDRARGAKVNIFYFEDVSWRANATGNKAEQRKLDNLGVNARVKQRLRQKLGVS
jgi:hypothetical protein